MIPTPRLWLTVAQLSVLVLTHCYHHMLNLFLARVAQPLPAWLPSKVLLQKQSQQDLKPPPSDPQASWRSNGEGNSRKLTA